jgi:hypothetical protein
MCDKKFQVLVLSFYTYMTYLVVMSEPQVKISGLVKLNWCGLVKLNWFGLVKLNWCGLVNKNSTDQLSCKKLQLS